MKQTTLTTLLVGFLILFVWGSAPTARADRLVTQEEAARHGLRRAWFTQVRLDPGKAKVSCLRFFEKTARLPDTLIVQTDAGMIHVVDAGTGQTLWGRLVGKPDQPTLAVGANAELVGVVNGTRLFLLDRIDGRILRQHKVAGVPVMGLVLTAEYAFVPVSGGHVLAYPVEKELPEQLEAPTLSKTTAPAAAQEEAAVGQAGPPRPVEAKTAPPKPAEAPYRPFALKQGTIVPLTCVSFGQITSQPIFTLDDQQSQYLAWSTTRGLFVGYVDLQNRDDFAVAYQLRTHSEICTQPTYLPAAAHDGIVEGLLFSASKGGEVHAVSATRGAEVWTTAIGHPVVEPVVPIKNRVFVITELGDCYCLDSMTGEQRWATTNIGQFISASAQYVYMADRLGQIRILDAASGTPVGGMYASDLPVKFRNLWTDRVYLATPGGLVQCLHEVAQVEPLRHRPQVEAPQAEAATGAEFVPAGPGQGEAKPAGEPKPAAEPKPGAENPFEAPQGGGDNPFEKP